MGANKLHGARTLRDLIGWRDVIISHVTLSLCIRRVFSASSLFPSSSSPLLPVSLSLLLSSVSTHFMYPHEMRDLLSSLRCLLAMRLNFFQLF